MFFCLIALICLFLLIYLVMFIRETIKLKRNPRPKMNDNGFFTASAHLDGVCDDGDVIVVKPVYYGRERAEVGSETVFILYNGKILTVDEKALDD